MKETSISKQEYTKLTLRKLDAKVAKKAFLKYVRKLKIARSVSLQPFKVSQQTKVYSVDFSNKRKSTVPIFLKIRQCEDD